MKIDLMRRLRVISLIVLNMVILVFSVERYSDLLGRNSLVYVLISERNLLSILIYYVISIIHIVLSYILVPNVHIVVFNRIVVYLYVSMAIYEWQTPSIFSLRYFFVFLLEISIMMLSLIILRNIRFLVYPLDISTRDLREFVDHVKQGRAGLSKSPRVLAYHSLSSSLTILTLRSVLRGDLNVYFLLISHLIIPVFTVISLLKIIEDLEVGDVDWVFLSAMSGVGLIGLPAYITLVSVTYEFMKFQPARIMYRDGDGIYLGEAVAVLSRGIPRDTYITPVVKTTGRLWYWRKINSPLYVKLSELNTPHVVIVGSSGSGKTTLAKHIALQSRRLGYDLLIIDHHGEYGDLVNEGFRVIDASKYYINPLTLGNTSPRDRALQLSHVISTMFRLGYLQREMLEEVIMKTYETRGISQSDPGTWRRSPPSLVDVIDVCRAMSVENPELQRLLPYLTLIGESIDIDSWLDIEDVLMGNVIVDLSGFSSDFSKALFMDTLMYMLLNKMYSLKNHGSRIQLIIEEARGLLPRAFSRELLSRLFTESRKFGFSVVVISQEINNIPRELINNAGLRIFFVLNEPRSIEEASRIISGVESREKIHNISEALRTLDIHMYILHATGVNDIYIVKTPVKNTMEKEELRGKRY